MTLEALNEFGANTAEGLARCMNNESFYLKMVEMALANKNFEALKDAADRGDARGAFEAVHALKGAVGNVSLTPLYEPACALTEVLRGREEFPADQLLAFEHEALGMYLSGHPTDELVPFAKADRCVSIAQLAAEHERTEGADEGKAAKIVAMVASRRALKTKKGDMMCFAEIEDRTSSMEIVVFPELYRACSGILNKGSMIRVGGKISGREDERPKIIASG
jgi:DNA polymerase III alpha subunit